MKTYALFDDSFFKLKPWWMPNKLYRVVCQRSNPRSKEYMLNLLQETFPEAEVINFKQFTSQEKIILLYPDSIGLGWRKIENRIKCKTNDIMILNGRKRVFPLKPHYKQLLLRRFFEVTFLPEIFLMPFILLYGALITIQDKFNSNKS